MYAACIQQLDSTRKTRDHHSRRGSKRPNATRARTPHQFHEYLPRSLFMFPQHVRFKLKPMGNECRSAEDSQRPTIPPVLHRTIRHHLLYHSHHHSTITPAAYGHFLPGALSLQWRPAKTRIGALLPQRPRRCVGIVKRWRCNTYRRQTAGTVLNV